MNEFSLNLMAFMSDSLNNFDIPRSRSLLLPASYYNSLPAQRGKSGSTKPFVQMQLPLSARNTHAQKQRLLTQIVRLSHFPLAKPS